MIICLLGLSACSYQHTQELQEKAVSERIADRDFPSVFQAWNEADNLDEAPLRTLGRHDLVFHGTTFYGLEWNHEYSGLADGFTDESIRKGLATRSEILAENPNMILLLEIRYRDAPSSYLPENHKWWMKDREGLPVYGWKEGGFLRLELRDPEFRRNVAEKAISALESGVVDGIMLDWWNESEYPEERLDILERLRSQAPGDALVLVNANHRRVPQSAHLVNGLFMECYTSDEISDWEQIRSTLLWAESKLRKPRINCVEAWFDESREDHAKMRAVTTLVLTHSDGYALFSDPNNLPSPDHRHSWYPFWDADLGTPVSELIRTDDGYYLRRFTRGVAAYNPMGNRGVRVDFPEEMISAASGENARSFQLDSYDGDMYLRKRE